jgi:small subunit ribosomal protein S18
LDYYLLAQNIAAQRLPLRRQTNRQRAIEEERTLRENRLMEKFQTREWKAGDIYAPHDLSPAEMKKWNKRSPPTSDVFDAVNLNPLDVYKNFSIMSEYMTDMGRIKHRKVTGLRGVNQRKLAKAIRRAIGVGLMPSVHRHPEILAEIKFRTDGGF